MFNFLRLLTFQVSVSVDKKILMLFNVNDPENRIELTFQRRYGNIVSYRWYLHIQAHHHARVSNYGREMLVLKLVLSPCLSLPGMVMGIYSSASPMDTLWLFPLTSGRLGRSSTRLTTIKTVLTVWPSHQHWTRLPPAETTGTHKLSKTAPSFCLFVSMKY